ncbi:YncE family protein [Candidatus Palauibacter sp.]|uniref:YncE family protein n=1 Tax=Candidatus Palauibacter sp. TaxID=3101350 RepID=UPI003B5CA5C5
MTASFRALGAVVSLAAAGFACGAPAEDFDDAGGPFRVGAMIDVGAAPHGIRFSPDGDTAWVALSGEGRIAIVDLAASAIIDRWEAGTTPLDLVRVDDGWLVSQFRDSTLIMLDADGRTVPDAGWGVGAGPSLFTPGTVRGESWITTEFSDRLWVVDTRQGAPRSFHATGDRPYPADVMWDGSYAFVPNLDAGTVSVIDLLNDETDAEVDVCPGPPGGALTPDQVTYLVACGGSDEVAFINTASFEITGRVTDGLGPRPFSVVVPGRAATRWSTTPAAARSRSWTSKRARSCNGSRWASSRSSSAPTRTASASSSRTRSRARWLNWSRPRRPPNRPLPRRRRSTRSSSWG